MLIELLNTYIRRHRNDPLLFHLSAVKRLCHFCAAVNKRRPLVATYQLNRSLGENLVLWLKVPLLKPTRLHPAEAGDAAG